MFNVLVILCYFIALGCLIGLVDRFLFPDDCPNCTEMVTTHEH